MVCSDRKILTHLNEGAQPSQATETISYWNRPHIVSRNIWLFLRMPLCALSRSLARSNSKLIQFSEHRAFDYVWFDNYRALSGRRFEWNADWLCALLGIQRTVNDCCAPILAICRTILSKQTGHLTRTERKTERTAWKECAIVCIHCCFMNKKRSNDHRPPRRCISPPCRARAAQRRLC